MTEDLASATAVAFYGTVILLAVAEILAPWRSPTVNLGRRWFTNIGLFVFGHLVAGVGVPVSALVLSRAADAEAVGLLHALGLSETAMVVIGFLMLDLTKYGEHRLAHAVPVLWRLHRVHHSDVDVDFTTAERHHPFEVLFGSAVTLLAIWAVGVPPLAVMLYVSVAGAVALLSHANLRLPERLDGAMRWFVVTPDVHGVHHSALRVETDSNFGLVLTVWDRIFGTYTVPVRALDRDRILGLEDFRDVRDARLDRVLIQPFFGRIPEPVLAGAASSEPPATR